MWVGGALHGAGAPRCCSCARRRRRARQNQLGQGSAARGRSRTTRRAPNLRGDLRELGGERVDVVVYKDSFEHYGAIEGTPSAERMVEDMGLRSLTDGGLLTIGFGPLWKAPFGGHIDVRLPWAHLIFPQEVVFDEFRRVRPPGKTARTFEQGAGVNRMTLERFLRVMRGSGLDLVAMDTNVSRNRFVSPLRVLARYPPLREYCTQNVYGVWRLPAT